MGRTRGQWPWRFSFRVVAQADDYANSNGKTVLELHEAQEAIRKLGQGSAVQGTIASVLDAYELDLITNSSNPYNARWPKKYTSPRSCWQNR